jgi:hypothetical protein
MEESLSLSEAENSNVKMCIQTVWRKQTWTIACCELWVSSVQTWKRQQKRAVQWLHGCTAVKLRVAKELTSRS